MGMDALGAHGLLSPRIRCLVKSEGEVGVIWVGVWHCCGFRVDSRCSKGLLDFVAAHMG